MRQRMYVLKDEKNDIFSTNKGEKIVFLKLKDACFFVSCIKEKMQIEKIIFKPRNSVICSLEGLAYD